MDITERVATAAKSCARHPWRTLALALLVSILAGWATVHLPVYTSRQALLPQKAEVVKRLNAFLGKFGAASDLIVVLEGAPRGEMESFATELATELRAQPEIAQANERLDVRFLLEHAYLLMPAERLDQLNSMMGATAARQLPTLDESLQQALKWLKHHPPLADINIQTAEENLGALAFILEEWRRWLAAEKTPHELDWDRLSPHAGGGMAKGYFASRDGRMLFLFVHSRHSSEDFQFLGPFVDKVRSVAAAVSQKARAVGRTPPTVGLTGLPAVEYEEYVGIQKDIKLVIWTAAALIVLLILVVVRSFRWALAIFVPMGLGALWSLGLALLTVGHLTLITSSFIAILFGLGADYGIFTSSRIAEERRTGKPLLEAIGTGIGSSFGAVLTAGGAALLIFGALGTLDFPGFSELGVVAAGGVLLILISTWMVQPALYALLPPKLSEVSASGVSSPASNAAPKRGGAFPRPIAVIVVVVALVTAAVGALRGISIPFDYDVLSLLPKDSEAAHYQRRMVAESDYQAEVIIFTARDIPEARRITAEATKLDSIAKVQSLTDLFPPDAETRIRKAQTAAEAMSRAAYEKKAAALERAGLPERTFELLRTVLKQSLGLIDESQEQAFSAGHANLVQVLESVRGNIEAIQAEIDQNPGRGRERSEMFLRTLLGAVQTGLEAIGTWREAKALTPDDVPPMLRDRFFAGDGTVAVYAFPAENVYDPANLDRLMKDVYSVSADATGFPTTHQMFSKSVVESFARGTLLAVVVCLMWLTLVLRNFRGFALASLPLLIGGGWMLGVMSLTGIHYNYANIVALPLVIALAVDYGVWFSHRWCELKDHTPLQVTLTAGKVIALAAGTELAGLGAITLAKYRGVATMGVHITIGLLCCLTATLLVTPAIGQWLDSRRKL